MLEQVQSVLREAEQNNHAVVLHREDFPAIPARTIPWADSRGISAKVTQQLEARFPNGMYAHQAEAIRHSLEGRDVVIATRTSSGKSLIYSN